MAQQGGRNPAKGKQKEFVKEITPQAVDFSQWYIDVVLKTEMMDYAPVKGCMAIPPFHSPGAARERGGACGGLCTRGGSGDQGRR